MFHGKGGVFGAGIGLKVTFPFICYIGFGLSRRRSWKRRGGSVREGCTAPARCKFVRTRISLGAPGSLKGVAIFKA